MAAQADPVPFPAPLGQGHLCDTGAKAVREYRLRNGAWRVVLPRDGAWARRSPFSVRWAAGKGIEMRADVPRLAQAVTGPEYLLRSKPAASDPWHSKGKEILGPLTELVI